MLPSRWMTSRWVLSAAAAVFAASSGYIWLFQVHNRWLGALFFVTSVLAGVNAVVSYRRRDEEDDPRKDDEKAERLIAEVRAELAAKRDTGRSSTDETAPASGEG